MKIFQLLIYLLVLFSLPTTSFAGNVEYTISEKDKKIALDIADKFSSCAGIYMSLSWLSAKIGNPESSVSLKNSYRGWYMAGAYLLYSSGVIKDWQEALKYTGFKSDSYSQNYKGIIEANFETAQNDINTFMKETCDPLKDYQYNLVEQMRLAIATQAPKE